MKRRFTTTLFCTALMASAGSGKAEVPLAAAGIKGALDHERIGLLPADDFRLTTGKCSDCATLKQGLWYFQDDLLAVPRTGRSIAGYVPGASRTDDIAVWARNVSFQQPTYPSLVWIGSPQVMERAVIQPDGKQVKAVDGTLLDLKLVPKLSTNLSFANAGTTAFFAKREVRMRGALETANGKQTFVARTVWPMDYAMAQDTLAPAPLAQPADLAAFVREAKGGADSPFATRLLWERHPGKPRKWNEQAVIGIMLNGAQGDDDEAFGGHFAIATGRYGANGEWSDWSVNNFYNLDSVSEKGIIASTVPMDNYLMDLNSGQQYYRPSYMLVAVLNNARTAMAYQGAVQRTFNHFYRHDFTYQHAAANCAGISMDVFKSLGWNVPERGPTGRLKAIGAYFYLSAKDLSLASGNKIYRYLTEEQTRLYPAVAFEAAGLDMLGLVGALPEPARALTQYESQLKSDIEAILLVRIPQVPSSRAMGSDPVFSFDEYRQRVPADQSKWKIVPVAPRPFPVALRDGAPLPPPASDIPLPVMGIGVGMLLGAGWLGYRRAQRRR